MYINSTLITYTSQQIGKFQGANNLYLYPSNEETVIKNKKGQTEGKEKGKGQALLSHASVWTVQSDNILLVRCVGDYRITGLTHSSNFK